MLFQHANNRHDHAAVGRLAHDQKVDIRIPASEFEKLKKLYNFTFGAEIKNAKFFLLELLISFCNVEFWMLDKLRLTCAIVKFRGLA